MRDAFYTLASVVWYTFMQIVFVGSLWVLRVAICWWLDIDYVEKLRNFFQGK